MQHTSRIVSTTVLVGILAAGVAAQAQTDERSGAAGATRARADAVQHDEDFIQFAAMSSLAEVEIGRMAQTQATNPEVKQYAAQLVMDHTQATQRLKQTVGSSSATLPTELDAKHREAMQKLKGLSGAAFDREFVKMMVDDHREAVDRFASAAGVRANETATGPAGGGSRDRSAAAGGGSQTDTRGTTGTTGSSTSGAASGTTSGSGGASGTASGNAGSSASGASGGAAGGATSGAAASSTGAGSRTGSAGTGASGMSPGVQQFAAATLPTLQTHLRMAEQLSSRLK